MMDNFTVRPGEHDPNGCPVCSPYTGVPRGEGDEVMNSWPNTADTMQWFIDHTEAGIIVQIVEDDKGSWVREVARG